jgi:hypothetical protein
VTVRTGVGQIYRDLGILDPTGGAGVLALHLDRGAALLHIAGLINHQHRVAVPEVRDHVVTQVIAHTVGVPNRPVEQVLHAVRIPVPSMLSDTPAVLARKIGQQPEQESTSPTPGLDPDEPTGHPIEELVGLGPPTNTLYPVAHGHRLII